MLKISLTTSRHQTITITNNNRFNVIICIYLYFFFSFCFQVNVETQVDGRRRNGRLQSAADCGRDVRAQKTQTGPETDARDGRGGQGQRARGTAGKRRGHRAEDDGVTEKAAGGRLDGGGGGGRAQETDQGQWRRGGRRRDADPRDRSGTQEPVWRLAGPATLVLQPQWARRRPVRVAGLRQPVRREEKQRGRQQPAFGHRDGRRQSGREQKHVRRRDQTARAPPAVAAATARTQDARQRR